MPVSAGIDRVWDRVREIAGASRRDRTLTGWLTLKSVDDRRAVLTVQDPKDYRLAASSSQRLGELFREAVGAALDVTVEAPEGEVFTEKDLSDRDRAALAHPVVEMAKDLFGARVVRVERLDQTAAAPDDPEEDD